MANNYQKQQLPKNIKYQSMERFGRSSWSNPFNNNSPQQAYQPKKKAEILPSSKSLFHQYYRPNLLLDQCQRRDIQILRKNPIVFQEPIKVRSPIKTPAKKDQFKDEAQQNYLAFEREEQSEETKLNEFLFNYRQKQAKKKQEKKEFLEQIEKKISNLEKETKQLQINQEKQNRQLYDIIQINNDIKSDLNQHELIGKINNAIWETQMIKNIEKVPNKQLNEDMGLLEMNMIIEENQEYNQNFIEQVNEVSKKRKVSRGKKKSPSPIKPSFSKTLKKMDTYGPSNKKLISTMRNNSKRK